MQTVNKKKKNKTNTRVQNMKKGNMQYCTSRRALVNAFCGTDYYLQLISDTAQ